MSGVVFFAAEADLLSFIAEARSRSLVNRGSSPRVSKGVHDYALPNGRATARTRSPPLPVLTLL